MAGDVLGGRGFRTVCVIHFLHGQCKVTGRCSTWMGMNESGLAYHKNMTKFVY